MPQRKKIWHGGKNMGFEVTAVSITSLLVTRRICDMHDVSSAIGTFVGSLVISSCYAKSPISPISIL